jgi:hypothetical protein
MDNDSAKPDAQPFRLRLKDWGVATTGMVVGAVIGLAVEFGIESTGVMGPKIDALLEAQAGNFEQIKTKLDELSVTASTPEAQQLLGDLAELVSQQDELTREASSQLQLLEQERISFKKQQLTASSKKIVMGFVVAEFIATSS